MDGGRQGAARLFAALAVALAVPAAATVAATSPAAAQAPAEAETFSGRVRELFANRIILESAGGPLLVEPLGAVGVFPLAPGDEIVVTGRRTGPIVQASRIARAGGEVLHEAAPAAAAPSSPPPSAQPAHRSIRETLAALDLTPLGEAVRKKHHTEILARMKDGRVVHVSFDTAGRLWDIEDADHDKERTRNQSHLPNAVLLQRAREAGFAPSAVIERRKRHAVVAARNRAGEEVELHIDFDGYIYKQVWPR